MAGESAREQARRARERSGLSARDAERWERGAEGESRTAAVLAGLGPEWTHWHDLKWPGRRFANIDHIVIGRGGIFVIDSKNWSGSLSVKADVLRQNGFHREAEVFGCADAAIAVGELLPRYLDRVKPVLCFVRDEPVQGWARDVLLCSTTTLVAMLTTRPDVLGMDEIADAAITLQARMSAMPGACQPRWSHTPSPLPPRRQPHPTTAPLRSARPPRPRPRTAVERLARPPLNRPSGKSPLRAVLGGIVLWWFACVLAALVLGPIVNDSQTFLGFVNLGLGAACFVTARAWLR